MDHDLKGHKLHVARHTCKLLKIDHCPCKACIAVQLWMTKLQLALPQVSLEDMGTNGEAL